MVGALSAKVSPGLETESTENAVGQGQTCQLQQQESEDYLSYELTCPSSRFIVSTSVSSWGAALWLSSVFFFADLGSFFLLCSASLAFSIVLQPARGYEKNFFFSENRGQTHLPFNFHLSSSPVT
jgi:hypothetical protein